MRPCQRRHLRDRLGGDLRVVRDQRADQAAAAARGQRQRLVEVVVRHQRADRAEGLDVVDRVVGQSRRGTAAASARRRRRRRRRRRAARSRRRRRRQSRCPAPAARRARPRRPAARFEASAPIFTPSTAGSPTTILASRVAQLRGDARRGGWRGTIARRIAVHFWPALTVISRATSLTKRSNSSSSGATSGPRIAQLSESASALNGIDARHQVRLHAQLRRRCRPSR